MTSGFFPPSDSSASSVQPTPEPAGSTPGYFVDASLTTPATIVTPDFLNGLINEYLTLAAAGGLALDAATPTMTQNIINLIAFELSGYVRKIGDVMSGNLTLGTNYGGNNSTPSLVVQSGTSSLNLIVNSPATSVNPIVQAGDSVLYYTDGTIGTGALSIVPYGSGSANGIRLDLSGIPSAVTAAPGTATTQLATTAFVASSSGYRHVAVYKINAGVQQVSVDGGAFTATGAGTFAAPSLGLARVRVWGAGGGGGGSSGANSCAGSGGGGEYAEGIFTGLTSATTITVGAGGAGGNASPTSGIAGGTTSFGALLTARGGTGGNAQAGAGNGLPGSGGGQLGAGTGGTFRVNGASGTVGGIIGSSMCGSWPGTAFGTPASAWSIGGTTTPTDGQPAAFPANGGGGSSVGGIPTAGASGCVIVEYT